MTRESGRPLSARLADAGVDRRSFLKFCAGITATLALPAQLAPRVAYALDSVDRPVVIWLEFQDCAGDTEAFLRSRNPSAADLLLGMISLDYHETVMAAAGVAAEKARDDAVAQGGHLVIVEGSIPTGIPGSCTVGGRSAEQILRESVRGAAGIINVGTCSAFGGIPAAGPNPTGAVRVEDVVSDIPVVNLTGCPVNADNLTATIVHYLTFGEFPARDRFSRPLFAYGERIHDTCQRRGHFDAGQFAEQWGDEGHRRGWCLYRLGCKGPSTFHNCPSVRFNGGTSWPVAAGHGCVGCSEPNFWDSMSPFYDRLPHVATSGLDLTADQIGVGVLAATATGFAAHGVGKVVQHRVAAHRERQAADRLAEGAETPAAETDSHGHSDSGSDSGSDSDTGTTAGAAVSSSEAVPSSETDGGRETGEVK